VSTPSPQRGGVLKPVSETPTCLKNEREIRGTRLCFLVISRARMQRPSRTDVNKINYIDAILTPPNRVRNAKVEGSIPFRSTKLRAFMRGLCRILWGPLEHPRFRFEGRHYLPVYPRLEHYGTSRLRRTLEEDHFRPFLELDAVDFLVPHEVRLAGHIAVRLLVPIRRSRIAGMDVLKHTIGATDLANGRGAPLLRV
jgi:hypothetical protein